MRNPLDDNCACALKKNTESFLDSYGIILFGGVVLRVPLPTMTAPPALQAEATSPPPRE